MIPIPVSRFNIYASTKIEAFPRRYHRYTTGSSEEHQDNMSECIDIGVATAAGEEEIGDSGTESNDDETEVIHFGGNPITYTCSGGDGPDGPSIIDIEPTVHHCTT